MAVPTVRPKTAVVYVADDGTALLYNHCADVASAGGFSTGEGAPHPGKKFKPRHIGLRESSGTRRFHCPIASDAVFNALKLGANFTYGGVSCKITSKVGERGVQG
jgi:hypothetical protein